MPNSQTNSTRRNTTRRARTQLTDEEKRLRQEYRDSVRAFSNGFKIFRKTFTKKEHIRVLKTGQREYIQQYEDNYVAFVRNVRDVGDLGREEYESMSDRLKSDPKVRSYLENWNATKRLFEEYNRSQSEFTESELQAIRASRVGQN